MGEHKSSGPSGNTGMHGQGALPAKHGHANCRPPFAAREPEPEFLVREPARRVDRSMHTILIAEADEHTLHFFDITMRHYGFKTKAVGTLGEALGAFKAGGISLVLLDADRMGEAAPAMLEMFRKLDPDAKVIVLSTSPPASMAAARLNGTGFAAVFEKPVTRLESLIGAIDMNLPE